MEFYLWSCWNYFAFGVSFEKVFVFKGEMYLVSSVRLFYWILCLPWLSFSVNSKPLVVFAGILPNFNTFITINNFFFQITFEFKAWRTIKVYCLEASSPKNQKRHLFIWYLNYIAVDFIIHTIHIFIFIIFFCTNSDLASPDKREKI